MPVIAIDGPAASGKGTIARAIAEALDFAHLDTGSLYRGVGLAVLRAGGEPGDEGAAVAAAQALDPTHLDDPALRSDAVAEAASQVSAIQPVRDALLAFQRDFAANPPAGKSGAVLDGRDIGTVICPGAAVKIYVEADVQTRAERRLKELQERGIAASFEAVLRDLNRRDARDRDRAAAPLRPASGAFVLDTTALSADQAIARALDVTRARLGR